MSKSIIAMRCTLHCSHCGGKTWHDYNGVQRFLNFTVKIFTCCECGNTSSKRAAHTFEPAGTAESDLLAGTGRL